MTYTVFRYELMVKDMAGGGINPEHSTLEQLKDIDGRITFKDKESGLLFTGLRTFMESSRKYEYDYSWYKSGCGGNN